MFDLKGKKALVTGSTQGIGFAVAKLLANCGAEIIIHGATSEEKCRKAAEKILGKTQIAVANLADSDCAENLYRQTGDIDILVLNASVQIRKPWDETTAEEFELQIHTNLKSSLMLIQKYAKHMQTQNWGRIVTVGSVQEYKPHKDMAVYAASKCAQMSLVQNLAKQLAPYKVTINNLCPGVIATPRNDAALADPEYAPKVLAGIPLGLEALKTVQERRCCFVPRKVDILPALKLSLMVVCTYKGSKNDGKLVLFILRRRRRDLSLYSAKWKTYSAQFYTLR